MDPDVPEGHALSVLLLSGTVSVSGQEVVRESQTVLLGREGGNVTIEANAEARLPILSGEPIDEPVVTQGPFVMNTSEEIRQAMVVFQRGAFGTMRAEVRKSDA